MRVILLEPVPSLGDRGAVVNVAPGYARNYLLPKRLAAPVSKSAVQLADANQRRAAKQASERRAALVRLAEKLSATSCTITASATEEGHLYGSVTAAEIAEHLTKQWSLDAAVTSAAAQAVGGEGPLAAGLKVTESMLKMPEHIKELGVYTVEVTLAPEAPAADAGGGGEAAPPPAATVKVWVVQE